MKNLISEYFTKDVKVYYKMLQYEFYFLTYNIKSKSNLCLVLSLTSIPFYKLQNQYNSLTGQSIALYDAMMLVGTECCHYDAAFQGSSSFCFAMILYFMK